MSLIGRWDVNPINFTVTIDKFVQYKTRRLAKEFFEGVVEKTPVKTGRARACWTMNLGAPVYKSILDPNIGRGIPLPAPVAPEFINYKLPKYPKIFICNGQPYIALLENGYSGQAPVGMVRVTLAGLK